VTEIDTLEWRREPNIVDLRLYREPGFTPLVIFIDPQQEYLAAQRALHLPKVRNAVAAAKRLLLFAREAGLPVAFARWKQRGTPFFGAVKEHGAWIDGLAPVGADMVFERDKPSCYSSDAFGRMMDDGLGQRAVVAGFTGTIACLSTLIDGYHRGHRMTFLSDASASHALQGHTCEAAHRMVSELIAIYGPVQTTDGWIARERSSRAQRGGSGA
jgi:nicotinamidase-related amidase